MKTTFKLDQKILLYTFFALCIISGCQKQEDKHENNNGLSNRSATQFRTDETDVVAGCSGSGINHFITIDAAYKMIDRYQMAVKNRTVANIYNTTAWVNAETYSGEAVQKILSQPGCCSFRIYNGIGGDNLQHLILVGTNSAGEDILYTTKRGAISANTNANEPPPPLIVNVGAPCPSICVGTYITP